MAARDSRRDCRIGSSLSLRERGLGVRVQYLLNPDAEVEDIPTLTPALSRRERVVYAGCFRLMPMPWEGWLRTRHPPHTLPTPRIARPRHAFPRSGSAGPSPA